MPGTGDYFISVDEPDALRRKLLESSKAVIINLKDYHQLLSIRKNKIELISVLQDQIKELTFLIDRLNKAVPDKQIDYERELYEESLKKEAEEAKKREEQRQALIRMQEVKNQSAQAAALRGLDNVRNAAEAQQQRTPRKLPTALPQEPKVSDLDRLTKALSNIEEKLNKL
jgi:hypothetical protein